MSEGEASGASERLVCTDTAAIRAAGIERWLKQRAWPISEAQFHALVDTAWSAFDAALAKLSGIEEDVFLADTAMMSLAIQYAHDAAVRALAVRHNWTYMRGDGCNGPEPPAVGDATAALRRQIHQTSRVTDVARQLAKRWVFNAEAGPARRAGALLSGSDCWLVGSRSALKLAWAAHHGHVIDAPDFRALIGAPLVPIAIPRDISEAIAAVTACVEHAVAESLDVRVELSGVAAAWGERLSLLLAGAQRLSQRRLPRVLLVGEVAKPWSKLMAGVCRRRGGHVVADAHGLQIGHLEQRGLAWSECAHVSEYVCYNAFHRRAMATSYAQTPVATRRSVHFTSLEGFNAFAEVRDKLDVAAHPANGRAIMLIGHPMNPTRYQFSSGDFFAVQLALECEVAAVLRARGFRVIYKAHPDRLAEIEGLLDAHFDEVESGYLDQVWHRASGFVFCGLTTTALNYALLTDRPVALIDFSCLRWNRHVCDLLGRRAVLVPARIDEVLRASFDADALALAFATSGVPVDQRYARECLELAG